MTRVLEGPGWTRLEAQVLSRVPQDVGTVPLNVCCWAPAMMSLLRGMLALDRGGLLGPLCPGPVAVTPGHTLDTPGSGWSHPTWKHMSLLGLELAGPGLLLPDRFVSRPSELPCRRSVLPSEALVTGLGLPSLSGLSQMSV